MNQTATDAGVTTTGGAVMGGAGKTGRGAFGAGRAIGAEAGGLPAEGCGARLASGTPTRHLGDRQGFFSEAAVTRSSVGPRGVVPQTSLADTLAA